MRSNGSRIRPDVFDVVDLDVAPDLHLDRNARKTETKVNVERARAAAESLGLTFELIGPSGAWCAKDVWGIWYASTDAGRTWTALPGQPN